jgi:hypothetical protein
MKATTLSIFFIAATGALAMNSSVHNQFKYPLNDKRVMNIVQKALEGNFPTNPSFDVREGDGLWEIEVITIKRGDKNGGKVTIDLKEMKVRSVQLYQ